MARALNFAVVFVVDVDHRDCLLNRLDELVVVLLNDLDPWLTAPVEKFIRPMDKQEKTPCYSNKNACFVTMSN